MRGKKTDHWSLQSLGSCDADQVRKLQAHLLHSFVKLLRDKKQIFQASTQREEFINNESESGEIFPLQLRKLQQSKNIYGFKEFEDTAGSQDIPTGVRERM